MEDPGGRVRLTPPFPVNPMDNPSGGLPVAKDCENRTKQNRRQVKHIDVLPDDVLLDIFDFYVIMGPWCEIKTGIEAWQSLVHVCRRWRSSVFQSPRRLNLELYCTPEESTKDTLDVWPALPLLVAGVMDSSPGTDNVIAALEQSSRVCRVFLFNLAGWQLEKVLAAMQVPFPELTFLQLSSHCETLSVPDSFLGGSARNLRSFSLSGIPFPGLPKLLSSANHLVSLCLSDIPHSGYISPEAIVALISVLSSLRRLTLLYQLSQSLPVRSSGSLPPTKCSILPALNRFCFRGVTEYLEELITRIDTPQLNVLLITLINEIDFDRSRLAQFINCTPTLRAHNEAHVEFDENTARVKLRYWTSESGFDDLEISIRCEEPGRQLSSIKQVCNTSLPLSTVENLYIEDDYFEGVWNNGGIENTLWLQLLLPFTAVRNLYLSEQFVPAIADTLEELAGGRMTEVLPRLENILVEESEASGPFQEKIGRFVAERQLSDHPIAISDWEKDWDME